ncbi:MAG: nucleotidyltransferase family protein [Planctomycetes bacterium]|nr:nucleotidyltransferase family protein [Planctomycetota bacterium]
MINKESIIPLVKPLLKKHGVTKAGLFGSIVTGAFNKDSDIDFLVEFEDGRSLLDLIGLKYALQDILNRNVDIVTPNSLHPRLKNKVLLQHQSIYG